MSSLIRNAVSKKKRRYQRDGFDLDLSYITDQVIAMGFPSEAVEGVYRNPFREVFRFLELKHKNHYKVYNLCSERSYDISKFHNRVECFPFDDHNAAPLSLIFDFCKNAKEWLDSDRRNVAVIHCKAGKGRTGLMICAYLLYSKEWNEPTEAMDFYAAMRTYNKKGVTIPSQIRYINYFAKAAVFHPDGSITNGFPEHQTLLLQSMEFITLPKTPPSDIRFSVYVWRTLVYQHKEPPKRNVKRHTKDESDEETLYFECAPLPICGDIKVEFTTHGISSDQRLVSFWFNTSFATPNSSGTKYVLDLSKGEIDKANKDRNHKMFSADFRIVATFTPLELPGSPAVITSNPEASSSLSPQLQQLVENSGSLAILNLKGIHVNQTPVSHPSVTHRSPCELVEHLLKQLIEVMINLDVSGYIRSADELQKLQNFSEFQEFVDNTSTLREVQVNDLKAEEQMAFWINLVNLLTLHSSVTGTAVTSLTDWLSQLRQSAYIVGGEIYSRADILSSVLRTKMSLPSHFRFADPPLNVFPSSDSRSRVSLTRGDPRVTFLMADSSPSWPRLLIYHSTTFFDDVERASREFLHRHIRILQDERKIEIPELLEWHMKDFGKSLPKMLKALGVYLSQEVKEAVAEGWEITVRPHEWNFEWSLSHFIAE